MAAASRFLKGNHILQAMPRADCDALRQYLLPVYLSLRQHLEHPLKPIEAIYFMEDAIASIVAVYREKEVEVGIVGCEGMTGTAIVLGADSSSHATYIQVAGAGQRISTENFQSCMRRSQTLRPWLLRYVHALAAQTAHTAVANARADLVQRLARWILMSHDRVPGNDLMLTHEILVHHARGAPRGRDRDITSTDRQWRDHDQPAENIHP